MASPTPERCAAMSKLVAVAHVAELPPGTRLHFDLEEESIILLNIDGDFFAIADLCTHDGGPLADGAVCGHEIECPRHGARFDVCTGRVTRLPATASIPVYPVTVTNDIVYVEEPEPW